MKTRMFVSVLLIVLFIFIAVGGFAKRLKAISNDDFFKAWSGTWINTEYTGAPPRYQKRINYPDREWELYQEITDTRPPAQLSGEIIKKWIDSEGTIWYKAHWENKGGYSDTAYEMGKKLFPYLPIKWIISIKYDALEKIKSITIPKLIMHSKDDEVVPFEFGKRLFKAAVAPKEFCQLQGTHNHAIFLCIEEYNSRIDNFLRKYLK